MFAYGQTSSGKTHTMRGCAGEPGVIPLAIKDLFGIIQEVLVTLHQFFLLGCDCLIVVGLVDCPSLNTHVIALSKPKISERCLVRFLSLFDTT